MDAIYITYDPWIIERSEEILGWWLDDHPRAAVLDYSWENKTGRNYLVVYESNQGMN